ncbi:hypothetical protein ACEQPO_11080 [Bacillus sp. SL00103]
MSLEDATGTDDDGSINNDLVEIYQELETPKGDVTGMPSGFTELDRMTSGFSGRIYNRRGSSIRRKNRLLFEWQ